VHGTPKGGGTLIWMFGSQTAAVLSVSTSVMGTEPIAPAPMSTEMAPSVRRRIVSMVTLLRTFTKTPLFWWVSSASGTGTPLSLTMPACVSTCSALVGGASCPIGLVAVTDVAAVLPPQPIALYWSPTSGGLLSGCRPKNRSPLDAGPNSVVKFRPNSVPNVKPPCCE
jgi:hypothetical protein